MLNEIEMHKDCKSCEHLQNPMGGHCYMFGKKPELCRINTSWSRKQREAVKRRQFFAMYSNDGRFVYPVIENRTGRFMFNGGRRFGRTTGMRNYLEQDIKATNMMMQMNFAEVEMTIMANYMKCHNQCPFIKILFSKP